MYFVKIRVEEANFLNHRLFKMDDEEIIQLRALKKLLEKVIYLENRLKDQKENGRKESIDFNT